ncbi:hypothetical protein V8F33_001118 [Rhypophila sp. PSN 637]
MKAATIVLALVGAVMAQNMEGQPACATSCLISAISAAGCAPSDVGCQCGPTQSVIGASAAGCLLKACTANPADLIQAQSAGSAQCSKYSATATGGETTPTGTGSNATPTPTGSGTGAIAPQTTTTSGNNAAATPIAFGLAAVLGAVAAL